MGAGIIVAYDESIVENVPLWPAQRALGHGGSVPPKTSGQLVTSNPNLRRCVAFPQIMKISYISCIYMRGM